MKKVLGILISSVLILYLVFFFDQTEEYIKDLGSENVALRNKALYYLGKDEEKSAVPLIIKILRDNQPKETKLKAIEALGNIGEESAVDELISLINELDDEIRIAAIQALGMIKSSKAVKPLIAILNDIANTDIQITTIWALGNIGDKNAIPALTEQLDTQDKYIRYNANKALKKMAESQDRKIAKKVFLEKIPAADPSKSLQTEVQNTQPVKQREISLQVGQANPEKIEALRIPERTRTAATKSDKLDPSKTAQPAQASSSLPEKTEPQKATNHLPAAPPTPGKSPPVKEKAEERSIHRESWLLSQDSGHYTIQIMGVYNEGLLLDFINKNQLLKHNEIAYFETTYKGKPWFQLLYGVFRTKKKARVAANELPVKFRKAPPWIRTISSVQKTIQAGLQSRGLGD